MNSNFGEELSLDEILSDEEKAEDKFLRSAPGENFGPELTLEQVIEILQVTMPRLPPGFWDINNKQLEEALLHFNKEMQIGDYTFKIEYFARITSKRRFDFATPMMYTQFYPSLNGKGPEHDPQSSSRDSGTTGGDSNSDV